MDSLAGLDFRGARRLPVFLQTEAAECGLASLAMIASFHGHRVDLAGMRRRFTLSVKGATLAFLMQAAGKLQLAPRPLRLELDEVPRLAMPCILHWDLNHFVVLRSATAREAVIHDPAGGLRRLPMAELSKHFTGIALELTPAPGFQPIDERRRVRLPDLTGRVTGLGRSLAQVLALAFVLQAIAVVSPFYMQWVVDGAVVSEDRDLLTVLGLGFLMLAAIQVGVTALRSWVVLYLGTTLNLQWLANVFSHLLRLPVSWFEKRHLGDVVSRFGAVGTIQRTLTSSFVEALIDGVMAAATLAMMAAYSPKLTAVALASVLAYALLRALYYAPLRRATEAHIVHAARQQSHFLETVRGVQSIKLFGRQEERRARWLNLVVESVNKDVAVQKLTLGFRSANGLVFGAERVAVVWMGALAVLDTAFSVGMLFAFMAYKEQFSARVAGLIDKAIELKMLQLQAERLADIVLAPPEEEPATAAPPVAEASIEVRHLSFRYADNHPIVLRDSTFRSSPASYRHRRAFRRRQDHAREAHARPAPAHRRAGARGRRGPAEARRRRLPAARGHRDAGGPALRRLHRRERELLRPGPQPGGHRAMHAPRRGARGHRGDAHGLPHAHRRHGRRALGGQRQRILLGARPVQAAADPLPRRGDERARRAARAAGERGDPRALAHAHPHRPPAGDDRLRGARHRARERAGGAGPAARAGGASAARGAPA